MSRKNSEFLANHLSGAIDSFMPNAHTEEETIYALRLLIRKRGIKAKCEWPGCKKKAKQIVAEASLGAEGRIERDSREELHLCEAHSNAAMDQINPEFEETCPCCKTRIPVN